MAVGNDSSDPRAPKSFRRRLADNARLGRLAVALAWRASPRLIAASLALMVVQALLAPLQLLLTRGVIDRATADLGLVAAPDALAQRLPLGAWITLTATVVALGQLIQPFSATFRSVAGDRLSADVTERLITAANRWHGVGRFEDPSFADDLNRVRGQAGRGGMEVLFYGSRAALAVFTAAALGLTLAGLHPLVPIVLLAATVPVMARQWEFRDRMGSALYVQTPEAQRLMYCKEVLYTPGPAKDVRLYALGPFFARRYDALFDVTMGQLDRMRRRLTLRLSLAGLVSAVAGGAVYLYLVWLVARGERTVGDLALYGGATLLLQARLESIGFEIGFLPMVFRFLPSLQRVLEAPPDLPVPPHPRPMPERLTQGIAFEQVTFAYPGRPEPVLHDLSFSIVPQECVALVGHNGAGKTTIVKLLLRLYDPTEGRILLDGTDLREYDPEALRRRMAVIFQDFVRYELTAGENVGLGHLARLDDREHLLAAARRAGADGVLAQLPSGLDTRLGKEFGGRELSGGEWQKVALARAFARDAAQILVLDEPTAALDVQTEYDVYLRFHELTRGRATLLISHRFSTVRMADRILYLDAGRVQETGNHAELMALDGEYARLYRLQAAQYAEAQGATA